MTPSSPNTAQTTPRQDAELKRQIEIMRRAVAVPIPDDDSDFTPEKARRGGESWRTMARNLIAAFDRAALSPAPEAGEEVAVSEDVKELRWALRAYGEHLPSNWPRIKAIMDKAEAALSSAGGEVAWQDRPIEGNGKGGYRYASPQPARMPTREEWLDVSPELAAEFANIDGPWTRGQMDMVEVWAALMGAQYDALHPTDPATRSGREGE